MGNNDKSMMINNNGIRYTPLHLLDLLWTLCSDVCMDWRELKQVLDLICMALSGSAY